MRHKFSTMLVQPIGGLHVLQMTFYIELRLFPLEYMKIVS